MEEPYYVVVKIRSKKDDENVKKALIVYLGHYDSVNSPVLNDFKTMLKIENKIEDIMRTVEELQGINGQEKLTIDQISRLIKLRDLIRELEEIGEEMGNFTIFFVLRIYGFIKTLTLNFTEEYDWSWEVFPSSEWDNVIDSLNEEEYEVLIW